MSRRPPLPTLFPYTTLFRSGDQVYADELTPHTRRWLGLRRGEPAPEDAQVADFEEYTRVYAESWSDPQVRWLRSEEHTSELQSRQYLVCRLLLEKKKTIIDT